MVVATWGMPAAAQGETILFIVPSDTAVMSGTGNDVGIVTGRPLGVMPAGNCAAGDAHPMQNVIFVHPHEGRSTFVSVVVVGSTTSEPLSPGTRLVNIQALGACDGPGGVLGSHQKYAADLQ
jgi:hypothetical protein